ncbi:MAG: hypothetical protein NC400_12115 [Clostridium sp.]|nr:hypothetical protein [Clostridium sp.]
MKIFKILGGIFLVLFFGFVILVLVCGFNPELTEKLADFLYSREQQTESGEQPENGGWLAGSGDGLSNRTDWPADGTPDLQKQTSANGPFSDFGGGNEAEESGGYGGNPGVAVIGEGLAEDIRPEYVSPDEAQLKVPEKVSGRNGYRQIEDEGGQVDDETVRQLENQLGLGQTGDGLDFDAVFYPYYAMLDETGKHLYRQIYANANALNQAFAPVEEASASKLRTVFSAVYNDHPELFWVETAYYGKYRRDGRCVEIDLRFNRTAGNLEAEKGVFQERAESIIAGALAGGSNYEKEKLAHDLLIDRISYDLGAEMNQSAYSALVNGRTVCAGYARAFQYVLQQMGIPCYYCTGYAGENHAWNIVRLEDGCYNVDTTWDDDETGRGNYEYFNKTDGDYADTHVRKELSVYLPPCNGELYRNMEPEIEAEEGRNLRGIEDIGAAEADILRSLPDYYNDCYSQITAGGVGAYSFSAVIEGAELLEEVYRAYRSEAYKQGYMEEAMTSVGASSCQMDLETEELKGNRYLITHRVNMR